MMRHMNGTRLFGLALLLGSCASSSSSGIKPLDDKTPMRTAGARCPGGVCACRPVDNYGNTKDVGFDEGEPAPGTKRFEFRTGRGYDQETIALEGAGAFTKTTASPEPSCSYVDLPPGKHRVTIHSVAANAEVGQEPAVFIREYSPELKSWYDTFQFRCGGGDVCSLGHMEQFLDEAQKHPRGIWDPCGSVRIEGVKWDGGRGPGAKLSELTVELTLEVYKFPPRFPHGAPTCKGPSPAREQ
jgi:hypothetical protein